MEESYEIVLNGLKKRVEYLISQYEAVCAEKMELASKYEQCKQKIDNSSNKIKELEQKIDSLQLIEAFKASTADVKEAKQKISRLVRDIDKCIALLND